MATGSLVLGIAMVAYAIFVLTLRLMGKDEKFKKLEPMKKQWGEKAGSIIHYIGYVALPFSIGCYIIYLGIIGENFL